MLSLGLPLASMPYDLLRLGSTQVRQIEGEKRSVKSFPILSFRWSEVTIVGIVGIDLLVNVG